MNRPLIITIGITIILMVLGVWLYIFLFGTPEDSGEVFTNLGFSPTNQATTITPPEDSPTLETLVDTSTGKLRQLTTRSVAGFMSTTTPAGDVVRYAERGTGYIFEIDLATGVETFISRTTIPQVTAAVFSPNATHVAFTTYQNGVPNVFVGELVNNGIAGINLEPGASNVAFTPSNDVLYSIARNGNTVGYRHNLATETRTEQFAFAFENLIVAWGNDLDKTYITTKPASTLEGFMYEISGSAVRPVVRPGRGLTTLTGNTTILTTYRNSDSYQSAAVKTGDGFTLPLPAVLIPEKCSFDSVNENFIWCGAPLGDVSAGFIDDWHKGITQSNDMIWLVDTANQSARLLASPERLLGRNIDVTNMQIGAPGKNLLFKNKTDQTLWLYDLLAN